MDRHSSYIFIWLQLELCAMAVLLTKGEGCGGHLESAGPCRRERGARGLLPRAAGPGAVSGPRDERCWRRSRRAGASPLCVPPLPPGRRCWAVTALPCPGGAAAPGAVPARGELAALGALCSVGALGAVGSGGCAR